MDTLVLDIETKRVIQEFGRHRNKLPGLGISVVGIYSYSQDKFMTFREENLNRLDDFLNLSSQIVGFNLYGFDYPVLEGFVDFDFTQIKTVDIMDEIKRVISRRISLNTVAKSTLGVEKSGNGLQAIQFYHQDRWDDLEKYCLDDVRITRDIFNYGRRNKYLKIPGPYDLECKNIPVNWHLPESSPLAVPQETTKDPLF